MKKQKTKMNLVKQSFKTKRELKKFLLDKHWNTYKTFMDSDKVADRKIIMDLFEEMNDLLNSVKKEFSLTIINFFMAIIEELSYINIDLDNNEFDNRTKNLWKLEQRLKHKFGYSTFNMFRTDLIDFWSEDINENTLINKRSW